MAAAVRSRRFSKIVLRGAAARRFPSADEPFPGVLPDQVEGTGVRIGVMLTGEKLVDNVDYRKQLVKFESEAGARRWKGPGCTCPATTTR